MFGTRRPAHEHDCRAVDTPGHAQPSVTCASQGGPGITWRAGLRNMWTSDMSTAHSPAPNTKRAVRKIARNWGSLPAHAVSMMEPTSMVVEASLLGQWGGYQTTTRLLLASHYMGAGGETLLPGQPTRDRCVKQVGHLQAWAWFAMGSQQRPSMLASLRDTASTFALPTCCPTCAR